MSPHPLVRLGQGDYTRDVSLDAEKVTAEQLRIAVGLRHDGIHQRQSARLRRIWFDGTQLKPFPHEHPCPDCGEDMEWMPYQPREYDTNVPECPAGWWCQECERLDEHYTDSPDRTEND